MTSSARAPQAARLPAVPIPARDVGSPPERRIGALGELLGGLRPAVADRNEEQSQILFPKGADHEERVAGRVGSGVRRRGGWRTTTKSSEAAVIRGLSADKAKDRMVAASELAPLGPNGRPALKSLIRTMQKDKDDKVRAFAVYAIKQMGDDGKPALPEVIEVLKKDKSQEVRCIAADVLGRFGVEAKAGSAGP